MESQALRVVIAEDDFLVATVIEGELADLDVSIVGRASNGRAAVELVSDLKPDVVLMDVQMPEMDGIEAAAEIQERCP
ncbi:MAG: response regulator, partial [Deltaproteobacteria bacterium]|nr:response regulator [Deltaproteobacteria bacterium]